MPCRTPSSRGCPLQLTTHILRARTHTLTRSNHAQTTEWFQALYNYAFTDPKSSLSFIEEQFVCLPTNEALATTLSKSSSVVHADSLSPELQTSIVQAGGRTLLSNLFDENATIPIEFYQFVYKPDREGVIDALDAAQRMQHESSSSSAATSSQWPPSACSALYDFLVINVNGKRHLPPEKIEKLKSFPIFRNCISDEDTALLPNHNYFVLQSANHEEYDTELLTHDKVNSGNNRFLKVHQLEQNNLKDLGVTPLTRKDFLLRFVFPQINAFQIDTVNAIMTSTLTSLPSLSKTDDR